MSFSRWPVDLQPLDSSMCGKVVVLKIHYLPAENDVILFMKPHNFNSQTQQDFITLTTCNCGAADSSVHNHPLPLNRFGKTLKVTCFLIIPVSTATPSQFHQFSDQCKSYLKRL